jgi:hypothetical protein
MQSENNNISSNNTEQIKQDISISMEKANLYTLAAIFPILIPLMLLFSALWGMDGLMNGFSILSQQFIGFLVAIIVGIIVHEYLHKIGWALFAKKPLSSIKFGFQVKTLSPYAHCTEPLELNGYRWGALLPGLLLGILPTIIALAIGHAPLFLFELLFLFAAGGDFLVLWLLRKVKAGVLVEDHPTRAGCFILENKPVLD